jgi:hypothetical protein
MTNIKITGVRKGTENQLKAKILGSVNLAILDDNGDTICYLNGCAIRATKDGNSRFIAMPSYKGSGTTDDGQPRYFNHFKIFPLSSDEEGNERAKNRMAKLTEEVLQELDKAGSDTPAPAPMETPPADTSKTAW